MKKLLLCMVCMLMMSAWGHAENLQIWTLSEPPGNFVDKSGEVAGLTVDVVRAIQMRIGNSDDIEMRPWKRIYETALEDPNILFFSVARTPEREDKFHWITLVMRKPWAFYARRDAEIQINSLDDAKQVKAIGVMRGDVRETWLQEQGFTNLQDVSEHKQNVMKLKVGRVPLIFYSPQGMAHICKELGYDLNEFEIVLAPHASLSHIAMSKNGTPEKIVTLWQEAAQQLKADGTFERIAEKWAQYTYQHYDIECEVKDGALNFWKE